MQSPDPNQLPQHVAIIMDGNGRWAKKHGLPRSSGHQKGVETLRQVVETSGELGIKYVTLFAFSSENWNRPSDEVSFLMSLLKRFVKRDLVKLEKKNVRIRVIGRRDNLQADILSLLVDSEERTCNNTGLNLNIAFNYGARDEILRASQKLAVEIAQGRIDPGQVDEDTISGFLDTAGIPDPDLVIRSSGEQRLSNFLLWQSAYAEFVFVDELWPDFSKEVYFKALQQYSTRERRFGGLTPPKVALTS